MDGTRRNTHDESRDRHAPRPITRQAPGYPLGAADSDTTLIKLWLYGRSPRTQRAYAGDIQCFLAFVEKPLQAVTLADLRAFADSLHELAPSSQARAQPSKVSLAPRCTYPKLKNQLAERILSEAAIQRMLVLVGLQRQHAMLRLMYGAGLRVTEVSTLQRAGLPPDVSPHWLRHAHASHALDRGAPISLVQATLGHASVATTSKYLHARPEDSSARYVPV